MNEFGVVSVKLKKIAKQPKIPQIQINTFTGSGKVYKWMGTNAKNVETFGEQSAAGLPSISGVLLLDVPGNSELAKFGFHTGDVIIGCEGANIKNFAQLRDKLSRSKSKKEIEISVMQNQQIKRKNIVILHN